MNKNILAIAIAAAAVAAPSAFAAATVYGQAHMAVTQQSDIAGAGGASASQTNVASNSSRLGIKGSEDLGAGMKAVYQMEFTVNMDGESADNGFSGLRNTFVGVGGGFGTVLLGKHDSPIKMVGRKYDLFGDQMGNSRNITNGNGAIGRAVDGRHNNVIAYQSPTFNGFSALVALVPGGGVDNAAINEPFSNTANKQNAWSVMADYKAKAFGVSLGHIAADNVTAGNNFAATRLGAEYTMGALKVVGLYQTADFSAANTRAMNSYGIGAAYKVTAAGTIKGQYYIAENSANAGAAKNDADMINVGYDHAMSKNTTAYFNYAMVNNKGAAAAYTTSMGNSGVGDNVTGVAGKDNSAFSVGIIHKF